MRSLSVAKGYDGAFNARAEGILFFEFIRGLALARRQQRLVLQLGQKWSDCVLLTHFLYSELSLYRRDSLT